MATLQFFALSWTHYDTTKDDNRIDVDSRVSQGQSFPHIRTRWGGE